MKCTTCEPDIIHYINAIQPNTSFQWPEMSFHYPKCISHYSTHFDHQISSIMFVTLKGGSVTDQHRYLLSTITYPPLYLQLTIFLLWSYSHSSNSMHIEQETVEEGTLFHYTIIKEVASTKQKIWQVFEWWKMWWVRVWLGDGREWSIPRGRWVQNKEKNSFGIVSFFSKKTKSLIAWSFFSGSRIHWKT